MGLSKKEHAEAFDLARAECLYRLAELKAAVTSRDVYDIKRIHTLVVYSIRELQEHDPRRFK